MLFRSSNSNFGAVFPLWDLIFGTFRAEPRDGHERMQLGLNEVRGADAHRPLWLLGSVVLERLGNRASGSERAVRAATMR